ncbi:MAG TPA: macro domain-containing protein [Beijerinckiaceae bacterium]|jgi:O-acetyl-ADP-ribose deacetylase (regulator of RNase III)|nr:macro domain-containing protein [Beijerinckiaceae bacterium]
MLIYRRTSLFDSSAQTLVNTVNCVGVMGKGIAKEFKLRNPNMFTAYKKICDQGLLAPGKLWLWQGEAAYQVLNFPTKMHWRNPSKLEWIDAGLKKFVDNYEAMGIREISFPRLGCGNGDLDWDDVRPLMERHLTQLPIEVYVHDYVKDIGVPEHMEIVAQTLDSELTKEFDFGTFMTMLRRAIELSEHQFVDLENDDPIHASMDQEFLTLDTGDAEWKFDEDDLWGVWVNLQKGLLTQEQAGWSTSGGRPLLALVSLLPHMRAVEIQKPHKSAEIAVEYLPGTKTSAKAPSVESQKAFEWH